jgi:hypothetical protein
MADLVFVAALCAFFASCVVYVHWCDRIIGPDNFTPDRSAESADPDADAASLATIRSTEKTAVNA